MKVIISTDQRYSMPQFHYATATCPRGGRWADGKYCKSKGAALRDLREFCLAVAAECDKRMLEVLVPQGRDDADSPNISLFGKTR